MLLPPQSLHTAAIAKTSNKETVFNWDRGLDMPATSPKTQAVVDFLCAGLADHIYAK